MAKRKFILTTTQEAELRNAYQHCKNAQTKIRYQAVRLYGTGYPVKQITDITGCSVPVLMKWCRTYRQEGITGLVDKRRGGNRAKLQPSQLEEVQALLHHYTPSQLCGDEAYTRDGQFWTVPDVACLLKRKYGVVYKSRTSYRELLHKCGFSRQRPDKQFKSRREWRVVEFEAQLEKNY